MALKQTFLHIFTTNSCIILYWEHVRRLLSFSSLLNYNYFLLLLFFRWTQWACQRRGALQLSRVRDQPHLRSWSTCSNINNNNIRIRSGNNNCINNFCNNREYKQQQNNLKLHYILICNNSNIPNLLDINNFCKSRKKI